jgi:general secretion pathway protein L
VARFLGLDLGTYSVKAVGLSTTLRGFQLTGFWEERLPEAVGEQSLEQRQAAAAQALLARGLHPDTVVCGVPGASTVTRLLRLPFTDHKKIDQVLPYELGEQIPFDLDEVVFDHQVVGTTEGGTDVLVAAMRKVELTALIATLKAVGIDPRVMCLDTLPFVYLAQHAHSGERGPYAIVDLGHARTSVTVLGEGALQYVRTLARGGQQVTEAIARDLGVTAAEAEDVKHRYGGWEPGAWTGGESASAQIQAAVDKALRPLLGELRQTFQAHAALHRGRVEKVLLCGGTSRLRGVDSMLAAGLGVEVDALRPLQGPFASFAGPSVPADVLPKALALGLRAFSGGRAPQMNLRKGELGFRGDFQYLKGRVIQLSVGVVLLLLLIGGYAFARWQTLSSYAARQVEQLAEITRQTLGEEVREFSVAHNRVTRGGAKAALGELLPQTTALDYLAQVSQHVGKEKIDVKRMDIGQKRISMEGETDAVEALDAVVGSLQKHKCFQNNVRIMKSGKNQLNNRTSFQVLVTPTC